MAVGRTETPDLDKRAGAVLSRAWRDAQKKTQTEVAALFAVSQSTLSDWESNRKEPSLELAFRYESFTEGAVPARAWAVSWRQWRRESKKTA